jgi:hypothetical protein
MPGETSRAFLIFYNSHDYGHLGPNLIKYRGSIINNCDGKIHLIHFNDQKRRRRLWCKNFNDQSVTCKVRLKSDPRNANVKSMTTMQDHCKVSKVLPRAKNHGSFTATEVKWPAKAACSDTSLGNVNARFCSPV